MLSKPGRATPRRSMPWAWRAASSRSGARRTPGGGSNMTPEPWPLFKAADERAKARRQVLPTEPTAIVAFAPWRSSAGNGDPPPTRSSTSPSRSPTSTAIRLTPASPSEFPPPSQAGRPRESCYAVESIKALLLLNGGCSSRPAERSDLSCGSCASAFRLFQS
jgi:hypothetical protein